MSLDVFINDKQLELKRNVGIGLTFQIGSVLNPANRAGNLSNKFSVPKTRRNTEILENLSNINTSTNIPYQRNAGKIVQDGIEIFPDGFAVIDKTGVDYSITIYSGNVSFFDLIKGRNVSELDLTDSEHDFTIANILASFLDTENFIYPIVDWGFFVELLNNTDTQNADALIPLLYMNEVLTKIASFVGYELKGTFLDYDQFDRLLLAPNQFGFLDAVVANVTGFVDDVVLNNADFTILSICNSTGAAFFFNIPLTYQNIQGALFGPLPTNRFIPDNFYLGTFTANAQGTFNGFVPVKGEKILNNGNKDYKECNINDSHVSWIANRPGFSEQLIFVHDIESGITTQVTANGTGGTVNGRLSMTETTGGFLAWSVVTAGSTQVNIYNIATAVTTNIYTNAGGSGTVDKIKIFGGRIAWMDSQAGGGFKMYDIAGGTTKVITALLAIGILWDHNGAHLIWEEPAANDINVFEFSTGLNTLIDNGGGTSGIGTVQVIGDYGTYWDIALTKFVSYKLSTNTNVTAKFDASGFTRNQARTLTKAAWTDASGDLMHYDLLTDTLTNTAVSNADVPGLSSEDRYISMNDSNIAYIANGQDDIDVYNITSTVVTNIDSNVENHNWVIIGKSNVITYHQIGTSDKMRSFDLTNTSFFADINDASTVVCFKKALNSDRMVFTNDEGLSSSPLDRIALISPVINPISVDITLVIKEDGLIVYTETEPHLITFSGAFNLFINRGIVYVKSGSEYDVELFIDAGRDETIDYDIDYSLTKSSYTFAATKTIPYQAKLDMSTFYNTDQEKVFKDIMNQYSLTVQTNELTKQVFLNPLDDLKANISIAKNWNDKINLKTIPGVKYKLGSYAQLNYFNYAKDEDVPADTGRGSFTVNDTELPVVKDIITLNAAASIADLRLENEHTPTIPFIPAINNNFFDQKKSRILLLEKITKTINWENTIDLETGVSTTLPLAYFNKEGKTDNLDFQSLIDENYDVLIGMLDQVKFISAGFRLTEVDIANLDFTIPVFLDIHISDIHINGFFYINKISNFQRGKTTKVDLIRL